MNYSITVLETELSSICAMIEDIKKYPDGSVKNDLIKTYTKRRDDLINSIAMLREAK